MATIKSKKAFPERTVNIARFSSRAIFRQNNDFRFDVLLFKSCCLPHKSFDDLLMVLGEHGWYRIPFSRKLK